MMITVRDGSVGSRSWRSQRLKLSIRPSTTRRQERAQHIGPAPRMPVVLAGAPLSTRGISVRAGHVGGEAAFVKIDDTPAITLILIDFLSEGLPYVFVGLRVRQGFLYM